MVTPRRHANLRNTLRPPAFATLPVFATNLVRRLAADVRVCDRPHWRMSGHAYYFVWKILGI